MHAIDVRDRRKSYGEVTAVDGLSFHVEAGEVYALLGANGAGKSTAVEILEGHRTDLTKTYARIIRDPRHTELQILLQQTNTHRRFPLWSMGT